MLICVSRVMAVGGLTSNAFGGGDATGVGGASISSLMHGVGVEEGGVGGVGVILPA